MPPKGDKKKEKGATLARRRCTPRRTPHGPNQRQHSSPDLLPSIRVGAAADSGEAELATIAKAFELQNEALQRQLGEHACNPQRCETAQRAAVCVAIIDTLVVTRARTGSEFHAAHSSASLHGCAAERTERALAAERVSNELRARMRQMEADMVSNEKSTLDITAEMTRQYKAMQENLMAKITSLESDIHRLRDDLGEWGCQRRQHWRLAFTSTKSRKLPLP
jgi:hypothetical protein